ncbi:MAG: hypothetical protein J6X72_03880 [Clostridia bacterium]|nr:hypothetical protein [Clostridia bacterium]
MMLWKEKKRRECCSPAVVFWIAAALGVGAAGTLLWCKRNDAKRAVKKAGKKCADALDHAVDRMCGDCDCPCD